MAKVKTQSRLLIPQELTNLIKMEQGDIGIFWDNKAKTIYISKLSNRETDYCVSIRKLDNKNRIVISKEILVLIGANEKTELVVALKGKRIYIVNPARDVG